jgi:hypothetical protein
MLSTWLHRLITIYLAALYSVAGFTGGSLHYLAQNLTGPSACSDGDRVVVYYHVHGPDYQGHFHTHIIHWHASNATANLQGTTLRERHDVAIGSEAITHHSHACPLLSLVSTLKLGHGACYSNSILFDPLVTPVWESETGGALVAASFSYARGPPRGVLV